MNEIKENKFLAFWCGQGLESIVDITKYEFPTPEELVGMIKTSDNSSFAKRQKELHKIIHFMTLRARFNTERDYEVYAFRSDAHITKEDIERMFEENPQHIVDFIRANGLKIVGKSHLSQTQKIF